VGDDELDASYIVPSVFHPNVAETVAAAVRATAEAEGTATRLVDADGVAPRVIGPEPTS
jgi:malic enzyme